MSAKQKAIGEIFDKYTVVYLVLNIHYTLHTITFHEIYCIDKLKYYGKSKKIICNKYSNNEYIELWGLNKCDIFRLKDNIEKINELYKSMPEYEKNYNYIHTDVGIPENFKLIDLIRTVYLKSFKLNEKYFIKARLLDYDRDLDERVEFISDGRVFDTRKLIKFFIQIHK